MLKLLDFIDMFSRFVGKTFSWLCLPMIIVVVYEVAMRKIFDSPTDWAHESTTMLYGTFCMIGAVWTLEEKQHARSEVIHQMLPKKIQISCDILTGFIILFVFGLAFWGAYEFAADSWAKHELSSKSTWGVPIYPFKTVIPVSIGLIFLQQLAHTLRDVAQLFGHNPTDFSIQD